MRPLILCYERLQRILRVLNQLGGNARIRDLERSHGIWSWEVEQAAELGWVRTFTKKPPVGRPSEIAEILNIYPSAKYPPIRRAITCDIRWRHRHFAINSVNPVGATNSWGFGMPKKYEAYMMTYPACKSKPSAAVGACRLMKRMDVRLMRRWLFCELGSEVSGDMPWTQAELIEQLEPLGYIQRVHRR